MLLKWLEKRPVALLSAELCKLITKISHRIIKICQNKKITITLEVLGIGEKQVTSLIEWINAIQNE